jgi:hypothetical protein
VDPTLEYCRRNFKFVVPLPAVNQVMTVCKILEGILPKVGGLGVVGIRGGRATRSAGRLVSSEIYMQVTLSK